MFDQAPDVIESDPAVVVITAGHETGPVRLPGSRAMRCGFGALSAQTLSELSPDLVVAALTGAMYDALEVAERLAALGYDGELRVLATPLPDPELVRAEIAAVAPRLSVQLDCAA